MPCEVSLSSLSFYRVRNRLGKAAFGIKSVCRTSRQVPAHVLSLLPRYLASPIHSSGNENTFLSVRVWVVRNLR